MAVLGLRFCARAFFSCGKRGPLFIAVCGPLTIVASVVAEHRLQTRRLSNGGSRAQLLRSMWDLPRPGLEPVSPALAGRLSTTAPPGKPQKRVIKIELLSIILPWSKRNISKEGICKCWSNPTLITLLFQSIPLSSERKFSVQVIALSLLLMSIFTVLEITLTGWKFFSIS